jgi:hypothetical protein
MKYVGSIRAIDIIVAHNNRLLQTVVPSVTVREKHQ